MPQQDCWWVVFLKMIWHLGAKSRFKSFLFGTFRKNENISYNKNVLIGFSNPTINLAFARKKMVCTILPDFQWFYFHLLVEKVKRNHATSFIYIFILSLRRVWEKHPTSLSTPICKIKFLKTKINLKSHTMIITCQIAIEMPRWKKPNVPWSRHTMEAATQRTSVSVMPLSQRQYLSWPPFKIYTEQTELCWVKYNRTIRTTATEL